MSHLTQDHVQDAFQAFHDDERGESSALSNIMLIAIAAIVLVAVVTFAGTYWTTLSTWINDNFMPK